MNQHVRIPVDALLGAEQLTASDLNAHGRPKMFQRGMVIGHLEVIESASSRERVRCRCSKTGKTVIMAAISALKHRADKERCCAACFDSTKIARKPRKRTKINNCWTCDDCPALRPPGGVCQACGEPGNKA
jgi:hypothetical protein